MIFFFLFSYLFEMFVHPLRESFLLNGITFICKRKGKQPFQSRHKTDHSFKNEETLKVNFCGATDVGISTTSTPTSSLCSKIQEMCNFGKSHGLSHHSMAKINYFLQTKGTE